MRSFARRPGSSTRFVADRAGAGPGGPGRPRDRAAAGRRRRRSTALALVGVVGLVGANARALAAPDGATGRAPEVTPPVLVLRSAEHGYSYGYAPTIRRTRRGGEGGYDMIYCSDPDQPGALDWLRRSRSPDGRRWSPPEVLLTVSGPEVEHAACDPSLVRFRAPGDAHAHEYLFYSGTPVNVGTAMFVARAERPGGPFAKWTGAEWEVDAPAPRAIIAPAHAKPDGSGFYGAGEQSVVEVGGRLHGWYTDDTGTAGQPCGQPCNRLYFGRTDDPTRWPERVATNVEGLGSIDVKYDDARGLFVLYGIAAPHSAGSHLVRRTSADGVTWSEPERLAGPDGVPHPFPAFAHNVGVAGDARGHLAGPETLVVFGATDPAEPACGLCWGRWNLYGVVVRD